MKKIALNALFALVVTVPAMGYEAVPGAIYKWIDAKGIVHYGDRPAANADGAKAERAMSKSSLSAGDNAAAQKELAVNMRDAAQRQREDADKGAAAKAAAADDAARAKACAGAREVQRTLSAGGRMAVVNDKGEKVFLDDAAIAERNASAAKGVEQACAPKAPSAVPPAVGR